MHWGVPAAFALHDRQFLRLVEVLGVLAQVRWQGELLLTTLKGAYPDSLLWLMT